MQKKSGTTSQLSVLGKGKYIITPWTFADEKQKMKKDSYSCRAIKKENSIANSDSGRTIRAHGSIDKFRNNVHRDTTYNPSRRQGAEHANDPPTCRENKIHDPLSSRFLMFFSSAVKPSRKLKELPRLY